MRIWRQHELGDPVELLQQEEVDSPAAGSGQIVVDTEAVGLTFVDCLMARGLYQMETRLPWSPCTEVVGRVREVGEGVGHLTVGDRVVGIGGGSLAEHTALRASGAHKLAEGISAGAAAAALVNYGTSWFALHDRGQIAEGETLLVHAGMGGVGSAAVQLGQIAGAKVIATAGGPEKTALLKDIGVDLAIDYRETPDFVDLVRDHTQGQGVNVCFDPVGGDVFDRSRRCMAWDGRLLVIGFTSGRIADAPTNHILLKNYSVVGVHWGASVGRNPEPSERARQAIFALLENGQLDPPVFPPFAFKDVPTALNDIYHRRTWGKAIVEL
ncbi:MAG: NADPH:quinone oxidoreductase family protein [Acidimicrobiia bacterium]|nr:NADPH:quinone oxidoreductase family protein [Acidimicrobiia bacterium]MCY4432453.1 NADPH:quinone oxidoreductase family protein [bacterium]